MDTEIKHKYPMLRKYGWIGVVALLLMAAIIWAIIVSRTTSYNTDFNSLVIDEVFEGEFNDYIHLSGKVETGVIVQVSALETGVVEQK